MKKNIIAALLFFCTIACFGQTSIREDHANSVSFKMRDSLQLTDSQRVVLYQVNMHLANQKAAVFQTTTDNDSIRVRLQRIENTRDSLYHPVLGSEKYLLYKQKKRYLISAN